LGEAVVERCLFRDPEADDEEGGDERRRSPNVTRMCTPATASQTTKLVLDPDPGSGPFSAGEEVDT